MSNIGNDEAAREGASTQNTGSTNQPAVTQNQNKNTDIPLVFMREADFFGDRRPERSEWIQHVELFRAIGQRIEVSHISGLQRVKGMWRIYLDNLNDKVKLMTDGILFRGKIIPVLNTNPDRLDGELSTRVRVKNIPLSADDSVIKRVITLKGIEVISLFREKLRVDGKLTNCETGDRLVIVKTSTLKEPLPNFMSFGHFTGRIIHPGQPKHNSSRIIKCNKCLEDGHTLPNCVNDWVCTVCKMSGHKRADCPGEELNPEETDSSDSETSDEESESDLPVSEQQKFSDKPSVSNSGQSGEDKSTRRKVKADRKQQSMDNFVTPMKTISNNKADRSPPTPAEELHDKMKMTNKKRKKDRKVKTKK